MKTTSALLLASLLALAGAASALQPAPAQKPQAAQQQLTPEQQAQVARQNAEMAKAALRVVQLVDQNKTADIWEGASPVAKGIVTRDNFVRQIATDRQQLGALVTRKQVTITRAAYAAGGKVPAGNYINVVYATKFANNPQPVRELVSFHLDEDKTWRVSGYSLR
jgi:hypothetical protein